MFQPKIFMVDEFDQMLSLIQANPLGALVVNAESGLLANHLPFIAVTDEENNTRLQAHIPRVNPLAGELQKDLPSMVIFQGPEGYISPSLYATKKQHGKVVPTWNYSVVHAHGSTRLINDADWIAAQIDALTRQQEAARQDPWSTDDAPKPYINSLLKSLVGIEVIVERFEAKTKASQNQPQENQVSVLAALQEEKPDSSFTRMMQSVLRKR